MNRYTFVLPSENQNAFPLLSICANAVCNVIQSPRHETLKYVDEFSELKKNDEIQKEHISLSLSLSLYLTICRCTLIFPKGYACTSLSLFLSLSRAIYICKNGLDPDQIRKEFRKECFVKLKICACERKYAKCRTKADAHEKMGFQYISISVDIVRSHARIQRGTGGPDPPPP